MIDVLFEDNHIIIINKEAGELVQGDSTGDKTLVDKVKLYLKKKYKKPGEVFLGLVHRIDRPTSGIVICAKTSKALTRLNEQFKKRNVESHSPRRTQGFFRYYLIFQVNFLKLFAFHNHPISQIF